MVEEPLSNQTTRHANFISYLRSIQAGGADVDITSYLAGVVTGGAAVLILACVVAQALWAAMMDGDRRCGH